tara:strand:+ start:221 stop:346 length:126 start_codon:yes stop_codon:yes gene_type:complete
MLEIFYKLFIAACMFFLSTCGLLIAISMWRKGRCDDKKEKE